MRLLAAVVATNLAAIHAAANFEEMALQYSRGLQVGPLVNTLCTDDREETNLDMGDLHIPINARTRTDVSVEWSPCCDIDTEFSSIEEEVCRMAAPDGPYCRPESGNCANLTRDEKMLLKVNFTELPDDPVCCKSCSCYGDPECKSFGGVEKVWIPCDGRKGLLPPKNKYCPIYQDTCESEFSPAKGPNGEDVACEWNHDKPSTAGRNGKGWSIDLMGSPCQPPQSHIEQGLINMTMHKTDTFDLTLFLGERGIIDKLELYSEGVAENTQTISIYGSTCFETEWVDPTEDPNYDPNVFEAEKWLPFVIERDGPANKPIRIKEVKREPTEILFIITVPDNEIEIEMSCQRGGDGTQNGNPRLNIEELLVPGGPIEALNEEGFCASDIIAEAPGLGEEHLEMHKMCTAYKPTAEFACRNLVQFGSSAANLERCARDYCNSLDYQKAECNAELVPKNANYLSLSSGKKQQADDAWIKYYCNQQVKLGIVNYISCKTQTESQGWGWAVTHYGKEVYRTPESCGENIEAYNVQKLVEEGTPDDPCADGLRIEFYNNDTEVWVTKYFIPSNRPFCNYVNGTGQFELNAVDNPDFFTGTYRFKQCDVKHKAECRRKFRCKPHVGTQLGYSFYSTLTQLVELNDLGLLQCVPNAEGSTTWCFEDLIDGAKPGKCCDLAEDGVCPGDRRQLL